MGEVRTYLWTARNLQLAVDEEGLSSLSQFIYRLSLYVPRQHVRPTNQPSSASQPTHQYGIHTVEISDKSFSA